MPKITTEEFYPIIIDENMINNFKDNICRSYLYIYDDYKAGLTLQTYFYSEGILSKMFTKSIEREINGLCINNDTTTEILSRPAHKMLNIDLTDGIEVNSSTIYKVIELYDTDIISASKYTNQSTNNIDARFFNIEKPTIPCDITKNSIDQSYFGEISYRDVIEFTKLLLEKGYTPTFFYYNVKNRKVVTYKHSYIKLLSIRSNVDGNYVLFKDKDELILKLPFIADIKDLDKLIPQNYSYSIDYISELCLSEKNKKGYLFILNNGDMVYKLSKYYIEKAKVYNSTPKGLFKAILNNKVEYNEIEAVYNNRTDILDEISRIESTIINFISSVKNKFTELINNYDFDSINASSFMSYISENIKNLDNIEKTLILRLSTLFLDNSKFNMFSEIFSIIKNNMNPYWKYLFKNKV